MKRAFLWRSVLGFLVGLLGGVAGCNSSVMPKTYPVKGSVAYKGGRPVKGGSIQFTAAADASLRVVGRIDEEDGGFTLYTLKGDAKVAGAPEGDYRVQVIPPLKSDNRGGLRGNHGGLGPIAIRTTYKVEVGENEFKIEIDSEPPP